MKLITLFLCCVSLLSAESRWQGEMDKFALSDKQHPVAEGSIIFVGSSSARMWNLKKSFPDYAVVNRGFGGSQIADTRQFLDLLVIKHKPTAVFLYAGDNDIWSKRTAEQVIEDFQAIADQVKEALPETQLVWVPIKPSIARASKWPEMKKANDAIAKIIEGEQNLHLIAADAALLGGQDDLAQLDPADFLKDGLHLSEQGYEKWNALVLAWLKEQKIPTLEKK